jgi:hypothetical protein
VTRGSPLVALVANDRECSVVASFESSTFDHGGECGLNRAPRVTSDLFQLFERFRFVEMTQQCVLRGSAAPDAGLVGRVFAFVPPHPDAPAESDDEGLSVHGSEVSRGGARPPFDVVCDLLDGVGFNEEGHDGVTDGMPPIPGGFRGNDGRRAGFAVVAAGRTGDRLRP